jgi:hypothetical protein
MPDTITPPPTVAPPSNGATRLTVPNRSDPAEQPPRNRLLARLTSLTSVATVAAAGMIIVGILAVVGGSYDKQVVHDQLAPQKIFFPPAGSPALLPGIKQYAGQQLLTGGQAKAYADKFIAVHLSEVAGGKTYAQVSAAAIAAPKNPTLAAQKATLFQGETLRGLLLGAWGWSMIGTIATLAGIVLIALGLVLFVLPLMNWRINLRDRTAAPAAADAGAHS